MAEENYIDIRRETKLTPDEIAYIERNPEGLTREGAEKSLDNWRHSSNRYKIAQFESMLKYGKSFTNSGKTVDGRTIYARVNGKITWTE